jgi:hypothetical protein
MPPDELIRSRSAASNAQTDELVGTYDRPAEDQADAEMSFPKMLVQAGYNLPSSTARFAGSIYNALRNPIGTAVTVSDLGAGAIQNALPESVLNALGPTGLRVLFGDRNKDMKDLATAVGKHYATTYGSIDGFKREFAKDPVGILSDLSVVVGGAAAIAPAKIAPKLKVVSSAIDPVNIGAGGLSKSGGLIGDITTAGAGVLTGAGAKPIREAYASGREGGQRAEQFSGQMRETRPMTEPLDIARENINEIRRQRGEDYRSGMVDIKNDKSILSFDDIDNALIEGLERVTFKGVSKNQRASDALQEAGAEVAAWKQLDPQQYHTPEGFDALKQRVSAILDSIPYPDAPARAVVGALHDSVRNTINTQAPAYAGVMKDYQNMSGLLDEIERTLSLNPKASVDTSMRKLQSLMRNNANTNYGQRLNTASRLEEMGGQSFMPALAGQSLQSWAPRGIQGGVSGLTNIGAYSLAGIPGAVASAAISSPRLMGEVAHGAGTVTRKIADSGRYIPPNVMEILANPMTRNLLNQAGSLDQENN